MVQSNCTPNLDKILAQLLFQRDYFHSRSLISLFKIAYYNSNNAPPPLRGPLNKINNRYDTIFFLSRVDHQVSEEAIHQIWSRYLKDLSHYTHLVPSSLLFDTPLRHVVFSQYQTKHGSPCSQVD